MAAPYIIRRALVAIKQESTEGTPETLAAADADILAENISWSYEVPYFMREAVSASYSKFAGTSGGPRLCSLSFDVCLAGSGTATTPTSWGKALEACGFSETVGASEVEYDFNSTGDPAFTVGWYVDGLFYRMFGARANVTFRLVSGEPAKASFEFKGVYTKPADTALLAGVSYETTVPPALLSGTMTLDSVALKAKNLELAVNNTLTPREDLNSANGVFSVVRTNREPSGSVDPEMTAVSTKDWFATMEANTQVVLQAIAGAASGNIIQFDAPKVQYELATPADRDGILTNQLTLRLNRNAGDDELKVTTK